MPQPELKEGSVFNAELTTFGLRTGKLHKIWSRFAIYNGKLYTATNTLKKDWCRNILKNNKIVYHWAGKDYAGKARLVNDDALRLQILQMRDKGAINTYTPRGRVFQIDFI